jgi:hypothetical protein
MQNKKLPKLGVGSILSQLSPLASLIPGAGSIVAPALSAIGNIIESNNVPTQPQISNIITDPYKLAKGGTISKNFKQYNSPSHDDGGQPINNEGQVDFNNPDVEIELKENKYNFTQLPDLQGTKYVFSDKNGTAKMAEDISKKYKDTDQDSIKKTTMELKLKKLMNINELIKSPPLKGFDVDNSAANNRRYESLGKFNS